MQKRPAVSHGKSYCSYTEKFPRMAFSPILDPNSRTFGTEGKIVRAGYHYSPETLLAGMDAALTELVILAPAVLAQEECPFQTPFLAQAHKSPISGGFFCGAGLSGAFRSAHSRFASSSRSRIEGFFSGMRFCAPRSEPFPVPPHGGHCCDPINPLGSSLRLREGSPTPPAGR